MKTFLRAFVFIISTYSYCQNSTINYKAIIKDNLGNVISNDVVVIEFTVFANDGSTAQYREQHSPTTDANGILIVNIGNGTPSLNTFSAIDWSEQGKYLGVRINTGSGFQDFGTTQFMSVPYAKNAEIASNVSGLEKINEGSGIGWRLIGLDPDNFGPIGSNSVDLSKSFGTSTFAGATGNNATAFGGNVIASGNTSTAMGIATYASGNFSTAMGNATSALGDNSTSMGAGTEALGENATAMGQTTRATAFISTATGRFNVGGGNPTSWIETDPLFEIGNGTSLSTTSNALTILKNGTITAPSLTNTLINTAGNKALITKEYFDANGASGLEALDEGNGIGWRLKGKNPLYYGNIGFNAIDFSSSIAISSSFGATGNFSTAFGTNTIASGYASFTVGTGTIASGFFSSAMGNGSIASGTNSAAFGNQTQSQSFTNMAIGRFNVGGGNATTWVATDPLFEIGNGASSGSRANAVTVLKNGNVGIGINPTAKLHVNGRIQFGSAEFLQDGGTFQVEVGGSLRPETNNVTDIGTSTHRWNTIYATNGTINTSDRRDKINISALNYGLTEIMKLKPVSFNWNDNPNKDKKLGLIAQDVLEVVPEVVKTHYTAYVNENDKTITKEVEMERLGVYYSDLIPVLIKSIQDLKKENDLLKTRIEALEKKSNN